MHHYVYSFKKEFPEKKQAFMKIQKLMGFDHNYKTYHLKKKFLFIQKKGSNFKVWETSKTFQIFCIHNFYFVVSNIFHLWKITTISSSFSYLLQIEMFYFRRIKGQYICYTHVYRLIIQLQHFPHSTGTL